MKAKSWPEADLNRLRRRGIWLESMSMAWTLAVAAAALAAGIVASSIALIGLGLESAIELCASAICLSQLLGRRAPVRAEPLVLSP